MYFSDLFLGSVEQFRQLHEKTGQVEAGNNGPHGHRETALRNTTHWIISLSKAYGLTQDKKYFDKALELGTTLMTGEFRPYGYSFHARDETNVDTCNGLIGQAWTFEALAELTRLTGDTHYQDLGIEVANQHRFHKGFSLWHSLDIDGTVLNIDNVFNHQLWFCAAAAEVNQGKSPALSLKISEFMGALDKNLTTSEDGLIDHHIKRVLKSPGVRLQGLWKHVRNGSLYHRLFKQNNQGASASSSKAEREIGYQCFNTHAFAMMKQALGRSCKLPEKVDKAVGYLLYDDYRQLIEGNKYGFPYNLPGLEVPYSILVLSDLDSQQAVKTSEYWINRQIALSYDPESKMMSRNCPDTATQSARIYEAARLPDWFLSSIPVATPAVTGH